MHSVLVISDEPALAETLASELEGYVVEETRFKEASVVIQKKKFRLVLMDEGLINDDLTARLATAKIPVISLKRPVRLPDLLYTIQEKLQSKTAPSREDVVIAPGYRLSPGEKLLLAEDGNNRIALTEKEVGLLLCLLEQGENAIPRDKLLKRVWGYSDDIATHTLETHIYRLRGKLRQANETFDIIFSEEGGYRLSLA